MTHVGEVDLDWDSKCNMLGFWHWHLHNELKRAGACTEDIESVIGLPNDALREILASLCRNGCMECVLGAVEDLEFAVRDKAITVLRNCFFGLLS